MRKPRIFFYVQHLLGIGHIKRAAAIARALTRAGADVVFVSGGAPTAIDIASARFVQLSPALAADARFSALHDETGKPIGAAWQATRRAQLLDTFTETAPDALLIEMFPFGRRAFRFELLPLLERAHANAIPVFCSVRDILVGKSDDEKARAAADLINRFFDRVLVHGDRRLVPFEESFSRAEAIAGKLLYTGYVTDARPMPSALTQGGDPGMGEVLVSVGGGAVGAPLIAAAIAAKPLSRARDLPWRILAGTHLPELHAQAFAAEAHRASIVFEKFRADFQSLLARARLSISQGGYNTVMDILATGTPAVIVPFAEGQESEQTTRARLLAARGRITLLEAAALSPEMLAAAIDAALRDKGARHGKPDIDLDGATVTARFIMARLKTLDGQKKESATRAAALVLRNTHIGDASWDSLRRELDRWGEGEAVAEFWWRDDDATAATPALARLFSITRVPLALAAVPALAQESLADALLLARRTVPGIAVLQHGWAHVNQASQDDRKSEFPAQVPMAAAISMLKRGRERLEGLLGSAFLPVLTPPWNRIDAALIAYLGQAGLTGLSRFHPRLQAQDAHGIRHLNTHVDIVDWRKSPEGNGSTRPFFGAGPVLAALCDHLAARRQGRVDPTEPTGLLTHHLVHDLEAWRFLEKLQDCLLVHPAARWLDPKEAFDRAAP